MQLHILWTVARAQRTPPTDDGGSGLGLALVAAVATRHGGTAEVSESERLSGAKFVLTLLAAPIPLP